MPYPLRPQLQPLSEFAGTAAVGRFLDRDLTQRLETYIVTAYTDGWSLRGIAELVDRTRPPSAACSPPTRCPAAPPALPAQARAAALIPADQPRCR